MAEKKITADMGDHQQMHHRQLFSWAAGASDRCADFVLFLIIADSGEWSVDAMRTRPQ